MLLPRASRAWRRSFLREPDLQRAWADHSKKHEPMGAPSCRRRWAARRARCARHQRLAAAQLPAAALQHSRKASVLRCLLGAIARVQLAFAFQTCGRTRRRHCSPVVCSGAMPAAAPAARFCRRLLRPAPAAVQMCLVLCPPLLPPCSPPPTSPQLWRVACSQLWRVARHSTRKESGEENRCWHNTTALLN